MTSSPSAFTRLSASLKRALGPAGADGRLASDAAAAAKRLAGVAAVRDPPASSGGAGGGGGGGASASATAAGAATTSPAGPPLSPAAAAALARDWAKLVDAVRVHQDLLTSYDIGVERDSRQLEDVRRSAARVGLRLPAADKE